MKLQFAYGNPRQAKNVAKRKKKPKTKSVKAKISNLKKAKVTMAKKQKRVKKGLKHVSTKRRHKKKKNPITMMAYKTKDGKKRLVGSAKFNTVSELKKKYKTELDLSKLKKELTSAPFEKREALRKRIVAIQKNLSDLQAKQKYMQRLKEEGADIKSFYKPESAMAKKRKKKKATKAKKAVKRKASKRKASKRKAKKVKSVAKKVSKAKAKKVTKRRRKKSRRSKMVTHTHAQSTRHVRRGSKAKVSAKKRKGSYKVKTYFGKGRKKVKMTGRVRVSKSGLKGIFKINPFRSNPMKQMKTYLGLSGAEVTSLAVGGAAVPVVNGLVNKYLPNVSSMVSQYVGPQAAGSVLPILAGIAANAAAEHGVKSGKAHEYLKLAGEGLCAAGIVSLVAALSARYVNPAVGLAGINYTPALSGMGNIRFTPGMGDIRYTPKSMGIMPTMGIMPQLSGPDFGGADFASGGSREARTSSADFGADHSLDSEADHFGDDEQNISSSMS